MKLLLVSDAGNIHTKRWAAALSDAGIDVTLFSITPSKDDFYHRHGIHLHVHDLFSYKKGAPSDMFASVPAHFKAVKQLQKVIKKEKPDILHAHYATSYAMVAALTGFHPLIISVWGSDIYEFPKKSPINRLAVEFTLAKADSVLSTSHAMAAETRKYFDGAIKVTPFGVDVKKFAPGAASGTAPGAASGTSPGTAPGAGAFVFGTVKTLSQKYGIDLLLKAFAETVDNNPATPMRLLIAGDGPDRNILEQLANNLNISTLVTFLGPVEHDEVPEVYARMDAAVFLSREESFGVAAVEAMACGLPVIASDTPGFSEILEDGAGIIVPRENVSAAAQEMQRLASDPRLRQRLATAGRTRVLARYDWSDSVRTMIAEYKNLITK